MHKGLDQSTGYPVASLFWRRMVPAQKMSEHSNKKRTQNAFKSD
jgi:hypothetical protein